MLHEGEKFSFTLDGMKYEWILLFLAYFQYIHIPNSVKSFRR